MTKSAIWHPFTQHATAPFMPKVVSASGAYLHLEDGSKVLDAIASWWVITHGHSHPKVSAAIAEQSAKLGQVIFAGYRHEPAEALAKILIDITPDELEYVFYSDSGSTAVEVALKMAIGFYANQNIDRSQIIVMQHSYHGDTIGTMSVGERGVFNAAYSDLLFDVKTVPFPHEGKEQDTYDALEGYLKSGKVAAYIVEPMILGSGGMLMYSAEVLAEMYNICQKHDVLFIADEVMTGWGRTGTKFAFDQAKIVPDIICLSKGITGGSLPLAVTMCKAEIYDAHYSTDRSKMFFHSSSYTANSICCAAAVANLKVWEDEPVQQNIDRISGYYADGLERFRQDKRFENVRATGTIGAFDIAVGDEGYLSDIGPKLYKIFQANNMLIRPLGNTIYLMPPYCVTNDELDKIYDVVLGAVDEVLGK